MGDNTLLYLSRADVVATGVTMTEVIELVKEGFREKGAGRVEMPPKPGIHPGAKDNFIHAMPAYIPAMGAAGMKWVSGYPGNQQRGLPYISGLLILNDPKTGLPVAVMDCVWITAMRTGAATAVAAQCLARPESAVLGVLGCGVQGRSNTAALQACFPLERVMVYDVDPATARLFAEWGSAELGLEVVPVDMPQRAVTGCDLIVTAGPILKVPHQTIQPGWMDAGAFASMVDYDTYWHRAALKEADKFCTDDVPQLRHYASLGYFQDIPEIYADLGELVSGTKPGRETAEERTIACNLGLALGDMAVAPTVYRRAVEKGIGVTLSL